MDTGTAIAAGFFGQPPESLTEIMGLGSVNQIFVAKLAGESIVVRLPQPQNREQAMAFYEKERWCLEQAARVGVPGPVVLKRGIHDGWPYQVQSFVEGVNGKHSDLDPHVLMHTLGDYARRFHPLPLTGFGEMLSEFFSSDNHAGWQRFVAYNLASLTPDDALMALGVYSAHQREAIHARFIALQEGAFTFGLCHGDLARRNTILAPDGTLFLLDWGSAEAHLIPHYDLMALVGWYSPSDSRVHAFLDGYGWPLSERAALLAEVENLALLKSFDLVRWAIDRCPTRITELAEKARVQAQSVA